MKELKESTKRIIDVLDEMTHSVKSGTKTVSQCREYFLQQVSQKQVEACLTDEGMDVEDIEACKQMLKNFFNYVPPIN